MAAVQLPEKNSFARIRVFGIGGSGKNVVNYMIKSGIGLVEFIVANTDSQDLKASKALKKIHLGTKLTRGFGTGMNPMVGQMAAEESKEELRESIKGADLIFIACGLGGGTGTGAAPVVAEIAKELGVLTIAVVTKPFSFEGGARKVIAENGLLNLAKQVDAMIVIPNDNIFKKTELKTSMADAFSFSDQILLQAVKSIADLIMQPGEINVDFADVKVILKDAGLVIMGIGTAKGPNRANLAASEAITSQLIDASISGANRILFLITSKTKKSITMHEIQEIAEIITSNAAKSAKIIFGTSVDKNMNASEVTVTVLASKFNEEENLALDANSQHMPNMEEHIKVQKVAAAEEFSELIENEKEDLNNFETGSNNKKDIVSELYKDDIDLDDDFTETDENNINEYEKDKSKSFLNRLWK